MMVVVLPLRAHAPGLLVLVAQIAIGGFVYGALAYVLDIGRVRMKIAGMVKSHA
jgi:hypothetical protein